VPSTRRFNALHLLLLNGLLCACSVTAAASNAPADLRSASANVLGQTGPLLPASSIEAVSNQATFEPVAEEPMRVALEPCPPPDTRNLQTWHFGELLRGDPEVPLMALTFDAGAGSGTINELLDVLRDRGVRSTFFIAGAFADRYPGIVARIAEEGHELANHSYTHPDFRQLTDRQMRDEIQRGTAAIERAAGTAIAPLWRPPFGGRDDRVLRVIDDEGFRSIYWTFDSGDWIEGATVAGITRTDLSRAANGAVVVHHVSPQATARAMPTIIDELRNRGFELVTVSEILGYRSDCLPKLGED
jgi:peptidoglycan/xylan/chitin deacetylase (PgdA/CDA1 family)